MNDRLTPHIEGSVHYNPRAGRPQTPAEAGSSPASLPDRRSGPGAVVDMGDCRDCTASLVYDFDKVLAGSISERLTANSRVLGR